MKILGKMRGSPRVQKLRMSLSVYEQIRATVGTKPAETGGMLGGDLKKGKITRFFYDEKASRSAVTYSPDTSTVNYILEKDWNPAGVRLLGFVHSHPRGLFHPSGGDETYAARILAHNKDQTFLVLPIVQPDEENASFAMRMFVAKRKKGGVLIERVRLVIVEDEEEMPKEVTATENVQPDAVAAMRRNAEAPAKMRRLYPHIYAAHQPPNQLLTPFCAPRVDYPANPDHGAEIFARVRNAYDLRRMAHVRAIYIGVGGAAGFVEDMARSGLGEQVLIDGDQVSWSNLATQQTYARDVGRPKVECVAERILNINPSAGVITRIQMLDEIDDAEFKHLAMDPLPGRPAPELTVVCGFTDAFSAQARINRIALNLALPSLCAQVYKEGRAAEITFTHPDTTGACGRCILSQRYKFFEDGGSNEVTSDGTPIFSTTRLNAIKGVVMLAIIHHNTDHPRWGSLLRRIGNRNLIQVRMDPDLGAALGIQNFNQAFSGADEEQLLTDETIWRQQLAESPANGYAMPCPDCGGTGNLRNSVGKFADTRLLSKSSGIIK